MCSIARNRYKQILDWSLDWNFFTDSKTGPELTLDAVGAGNENDRGLGSRVQRLRSRVPSFANAATE